MININMDFAQKLMSAYSESCKPLCKELKLPKTAFDIIMFLANNSNYSTARDIVEIRKIKANLVSVNVSKLVNEGYLRREPVEADRRKIKLICTEKALPIIEKGRIMQKTFYKSLLAGTTEEARKAFFETVKIIESNIDEILKGAG